MNQSGRIVDLHVGGAVCRKWSCQRPSTQRAGSFNFRPVNLKTTFAPPKPQLIRFGREPRTERLLKNSKAWAPV